MVIMSYVLSYLLFFGPPLFMFFGLVFLTPGRWALSGGIVGLIVCALAALMILPLGPRTSGDWFYGITLWPLYGMLGVLVWIGLAQFWRWRRLRAGKRPLYPLLIIFIAVAALLPILLYTRLT